MRHEQWFALLCTVAVGASLIFLNLDGYQEHLMLNSNGTEFRGPGDLWGEPPVINWVHGWPIGFAIRSSIQLPNPLPPGGVILSPAGESLDNTSRWPFDATPIRHFGTSGAVLDILICLATSIGTYTGAGRFAGRFGLRVRFNLATILTLIALAALVIWQREWIFATRYTGQAIAFAGVAFGLFFCGVWIVSICMPARTARTLTAS